LARKQDLTEFSNRLLKNAVWWLLRFAPPQPFLNLGVTVEAQLASLPVGATFTLSVTV